MRSRPSACRPSRAQMLVGRGERVMANRSLADASPRRRRARPPMARPTAHAVAVAVLTLAATDVLAQPINIDCSTLALTPAAAYGAASGQTGFWNNAGGSTLPQPLFDT